MEPVSEFKYFGFVLDQSGTDEEECWKVACAIRVSG